VKNLLGLRLAVVRAGTDVQTDLCKMSAIGRPLGGPRHEGLTQEGGTRNWTSGWRCTAPSGEGPMRLGTSLSGCGRRSNTRSLSAWRRRSFRRRGAKAVSSAASGKSCHHRKRAASPAVPSTSSAKVCCELTLCHSLCWRRKISRDPVEIHLSLL
jgi:hypothetical protein